MKKIVLIISIIATMMLSACSFLDEVNQSVDYINEADAYLQELKNFAENAPSDLQQAAQDAELSQNLEEQLQSLKEQINDFNNIDAPAIAEDIHKDIIAKNDVLLEEIDTVVKNGELALEELKNSEIMTTVDDINSLLETVENLNQ
ncbi:DUF6376 family protein [Metabacillus niabensis]|uniref:DUF6376 family protein n=1 Tax=Metabacillus TaxID=2675233 RepID=UPI000BA71C4E|nr:hypothetical protein CHH83_13620 [Bacillus sp. 7586-K]